MNFGQIDQAIVLDLDIYPGTAAHKNPISRRRNILRAADEVAERTDCMFGPVLADLVAGQAEYCDPLLYRLKALVVYDASGHPWPLSHMKSSGQADLYSAARWRDYGQCDPPQSAVFGGVNSFTLVPTPSVSRAGGLRLEGYFKPGDFWKYTAATTTTTASGNTAGQAQITLTDATNFSIGASITLGTGGTAETHTITALAGAVATLDANLTNNQNSVTVVNNSTVIGVPVAPDHECPLPTWAHDAVEACAKWKTALYDKRPQIRSLVPDLNRDYLRKLATVEMNASTYTSRLGSPEGLWASWRWWRH